MIVVLTPVAATAFRPNEKHDHTKHLQTITHNKKWRHVRSIIVFVDKD